MQYFNGGTDFSFQYPAYDQNESLNVMATIYDVSSGSPSFLATQVLSDLQNGYYSGNYEGQLTKTYLVICLNYTDNTYTTIDITRAPWADIYKEVSAPNTYIAFNYGAFDQDSGLFIAADVWDTTGSPIFFGQTEMKYVLGGVYFAQFNGELGHNYQIAKFSYTDGTYTTIDVTRPPGSDFVQLCSLGNTTNNYFQQAVLIGQSLTAPLEG
jgi:hypothetical protein